MLPIRRGVLACSLALLFAATAGARATSAGQVWTVQAREVVGVGRVLATGAGMTLYVHTADTAGVSTCDGECPTLFPPLSPPDGNPVGSPDLPGKLSVFQRADGSSQVAYNDQPLYTYSGDAQPGDINGDGVDAVWHVAQPSSSSQARTLPGAAVTFRALDNQVWQPMSASLAPGAVVTWENDTTSAQDVACVAAQSSGACPWIGTLALPPGGVDDQGNFKPTSVFVTFDRPGIYVFQSIANPAMSGQILVGAPAGPRPPAQTGP